MTVTRIIVNKVHLVASMWWKSIKSNQREVFRARANRFATQHVHSHAPVAIHCKKIAGSAAHKRPLIDAVPGKSRNATKPDGTHPFKMLVLKEFVT